LALYTTNLIKMQIPLCIDEALAISVSLATIGVCVFCAATSVVALFICNLGRKTEMYNFSKKFSSAVLMIMFLICLLCISGCKSEETGGAEESGVKMSTIRSDLEEYYGYAAMMVETESVDIIKRQTNLEDKEDLIYVSIKGKNEHYEVVRNYKMQYLLYNDGWILEEITEYFDSDNKNTTTPLKEYVTNEMVHEFLCNSGLEDNSYESGGSYFENCHVTFQSNIEKVSVQLEENYGAVRFNCYITYEYAYMTENLLVPVDCTFSTYDGSWMMNIDYVNIRRDAVLNDGILGVWHAEQSDTFYVDYSITVNITSRTDTTCAVSYYTSDGESGSGQMNLIVKDDLSKYSPATYFWLTWSDGSSPQQCEYIWIAKNYIGTPNGTGRKILEKK